MWDCFPIGRWKGFLKIIELKTLHIVILFNKGCLKWCFTLSSVLVDSLIKLNMFFLVWDVYKKNP